MNVLERARRRLSRFVNRTRYGWSRSWRRTRDEIELGDLRDSSLVTATVGWIARNFPEAPVRVRRKNGTELEEIDPPDPAVDAFLRLLRKPNAWYDGILLWMATIADWWIEGNAYWLKVRNEAEGGRVVALWWVPSWVVEPKHDEDDPEADFISHYLYKPTPIVEIEVRPEDVVHFRYGFDQDNPRKGSSPLRAVLREILTDVQAAEYTKTILRNLGIPGVVISPDDPEVEIDDPDADAIKADFEATFTGDGRGSVMVLGSKAKIDVMAFNPQQLDLRNLRQISEERVSGATGVPAIVASLGAGLARSTFANYAEAREAGYEENIIPSQRLLSAVLDGQLLSDFVGDTDPYEVDFDVTNVRVLQEDQGKIWDRGISAVAAGVLPISDFNRMVGLPVDEKLHDVYLRDARIVAIRKDSPEATGEAPPEPEIPAPAPGGQVPPELEETVPVEPGRNGSNGNGSREPARAGG